MKNDEETQPASGITGPSQATRRGELIVVVRGDPRHGDRLLNVMVYLAKLTEARIARKTESQRATRYTPPTTTQEGAT